MMTARLGRFAGRSRGGAAAHQHHRSRSAAADDQHRWKNDEEDQRLARHLLLGWRAFGAVGRRRIRLGRFGLLRLLLLGHGNVPGESVPPGAPGYPAKSSPEG